MSARPPGALASVAVAAVLAGSCASDSDAPIEQSGDGAQSFIAVAICVDSGVYAFGTASVYAVAARNAKLACESKTQGSLSRLRMRNPMEEIADCCEIEIDKIADASTSAQCISVAARVGSFTAITSEYINPSTGKGKTPAEAEEDAMDLCDRGEAGCKIIETRCRS